MSGPVPTKLVKMLRGVYRGYAGEGKAKDGELFATPQRRVAEHYADKRSKQTGEEPHVEMLLVPQNAGTSYGLSVPTKPGEPGSGMTQARKLKESDVVSRSPVFGAGGLVKNLVAWAKEAEAASKAPGSAKFFYDAAKALPTKPGELAVPKDAETERLMRGAQAGYNVVGYRFSDPKRDEVHLKKMLEDWRSLPGESRGMHVDLTPGAPGAQMRGGAAQYGTTKAAGIRPVALRVQKPVWLKDYEANDGDILARRRAAGYDTAVYAPLMGELGVPSKEFGLDSPKETTWQFLSTLRPGPATFQPSAAVLHPNNIRLLREASFLHPDEVGLRYGKGGAVKQAAKFFGLLSDTKVNPVTATRAAEKLRGPEVQDVESITKQLPARVEGRKAPLDVALAANPLPADARKLSKLEVRDTVSRPLTVKDVDAKIAPLERRDRDRELGGMGAAERFADLLYSDNRHSLSLFRALADYNGAYPADGVTWREAFDAWKNGNGEEAMEGGNKWFFRTELQNYQADEIDSLLATAGVKMKPPGYPFEEYQRLLVPGGDGSFARYGEHAVFAPAETGLRLRLKRPYTAPAGHIVDGERFLEDNYRVPISAGHYPLFVPLSERGRMAGHYRSTISPKGHFVEEVQPDPLQALQQEDTYGSMKATPVLEETPVSIAQAALGYGLRSGTHREFWLPTASNIASVRGPDSDYTKLYDKTLVRNFLEPLAKESGQDVREIGKEWRGLHISPELRQEWLKNGIPYGVGGLVKGLKRARGVAAMEQALDAEKLTPTTRPHWANESAPPTQSVVKGRGGAWNAGPMTATGLPTPEYEYSAKLMLDNYTSPGYRSNKDVVIGEYTQGDARRDVSQWVDKNLMNYVRREMATPGDPLRLLAARGVGPSNLLARARRAAEDPSAPLDLPGRVQDFAARNRSRARETEHGLYTPEETKEILTSVPDVLDLPKETRQVPRSDPRAGELMTQEGDHPLARVWEEYSDSMVRPFVHGSLSEIEGVGLGELQRLHSEGVLRPGERYNDMSNLDLEDLGFNQVFDALMTTLRPQEYVHPKLGTTVKLPQRLALDQRSLDKVSVPQAVQRAYDLKQWESEILAEEAKDAVKHGVAQPLSERYPSGHQWLSIQKPESTDVLPQGWQIKSPDQDFPAFRDTNSWTLVDPNGAIRAVWQTTDRAEAERELMRAYRDTGENGPNNPTREKLAGVLSYEGDAMQNCVGGYCDPVWYGNKKIWSLRDDKGEPHVTVEWQKRQGALDPFTSREEEIIEHRTRRQLNRAKAAGQLELTDAVDIRQEMEDAMRDARMLPTIGQIKGKQNRAPDSRYHSMIHDLIKQHGPFGAVDEHINAGLVDLWQPASQLAHMPGTNGPLVQGRKITRAEVEELMEQAIRFGELPRFVPFEEFRAYLQKNAGTAPGYGIGGLVKKGARLAREAHLGAMNAPEAIVPRTRPHWATEFSDFAPPTASVVKPRGGVVLPEVVGWSGASYGNSSGLYGSGNLVELKDVVSNMTGALQPARRAELGVNTGNEAQDQVELALGSWSDRNLLNYIKREMATPTDPLRALAERGVVLPHEQTVRQHGQARVNRDFASGLLIEDGKEAGDIGSQMGVSEAAREWENAADAVFQPRRAGNDVPELHLRQGETYYKPTYPALRHLGFEHLGDELRFMMNPETNAGIPARFRLSPQSMQQLSVPQAVERAHALGLWRMEQALKADLENANNAATHTVKEYPDGRRWVQLKMPEATEPDMPDAISEAYQPARSALEKALGYEGKVMGHCVGGYCEDVVRGNSKIYSLRDKKGEPHVTIEVVKGSTLDEWVEHMPDDLYEAHLGEFELKMGPDWKWPSGTRGAAPEWASYLRALPGAPKKDGQRIVQIKGKGNGRPKEEYQGFIEDFVRSVGDWEEVEDLSNTNLVDARSSDFVGALREHPVMASFTNLYGSSGGDFAISTLLEESMKAGGPRFLTKQDVVDLLQEHLQGKRPINNPSVLKDIGPGPAARRATGGRVFASGGRVAVL